jgi:uncharacterized protein
MISSILALVASLPDTGPYIAPILDVVKPIVSDRQRFQVPDRVHLTGWLGSRIDANTQNRLEKIDIARLLEGYRKRPGRQSWDGEHIGKWLHAATLAWVNSGDLQLRKKLDLAVIELEKCQLPDGYLGTYAEKDRWTEWDVWAHKYNLLGLLTYVRYTGNRQPLLTCRRMADLLCREFGDQPGQRDLIRAGAHVGMAPTSVLEPMTLLYRLTGEKRYLDFCKYIIRTWEQPNGPHILSRLLDRKGVDKVGNGKAYEMLSCLNGVLELYRTTGEKSLLQACINAWADVVRNRLYITGAASSYELFRGDFDLPNSGNVGETCVTVTWIQLNAQLLRLTGEDRFAEQLEQASLNQLLGAQQPDGRAWGYYVQMEGRKPYSSSLDGHCCLSSGPRGIALLPTFAITTDANGAVVNLFNPGIAHLKLDDGSPIDIEISTNFPSEGQVRIRVNNPKQREFSVKLRHPAWSPKMSSNLNWKESPDGYRVIRKKWKSGEVISINLSLKTRIVKGDHSNLGKAAVMYGPLVLAADESLLSGGQLASFGLSNGGNPLVVKPVLAPESRKTWKGAQVFRLNSNKTLVPFSDAGITGARYKVWIPLKDSVSKNVLLGGQESFSRQGNVVGSIADDDLQTFAVTFNGKRADQDWFAISVTKEVAAQRFVFWPGQVFHDGGWFDTRTGKPKVQIQRTKDGPWETIGELGDYPAATDRDAIDPRLATKSAGFTLRLASPVRFRAVRVVGVPASGDDPAQNFSSCSDLQAFAK